MIEGRDKILEELRKELEEVRERALVLEEREATRIAAQEALERRARESAILARLTERLYRAGTAEEVMGTVVEDLSELFPVYVSVNLVEEEGRFLVIKAHNIDSGILGFIEQLIGRRFADWRIPLYEETPIAETIRTGRPTVCNVVFEPEEPVVQTDFLDVVSAMVESKNPLRKFARPVAKRFGEQSLLGIPFVDAGGEVFGSLTLIRRRPFDRQDFDLMKAVANAVAGGIEQRMLAGAVRESEERFRTLQGNVPVGIFRSSPEPRGPLLFANLALAKMFGYDTSEGIIETFVADFYLHPEDRKKFIQAIISAGVITDYEVQLKRVDGTPFWGSLTARAVKGPNGEVAFFDGVLEDITQRKRAEERSRRLLSQQTVVNKLALKLTEATEVEEIFGSIYEYVSKLMDAEAIIVSSYDPERQRILARYVNQRGKVMEVSDFPALPLGSGVQSTVIRTGQPLNVPDYNKAMEGGKRYTVTKEGKYFEGPPPEGESETSTKSALLAPLKVKGRVTGVMQVQSLHLNAYTQEDRDVLEAIANVAAVALGNAYFYKQMQEEIAERERTQAELQRHVTVLRGLNEISRVANIVTDVGSLLNGVARLLADNPGVIAGAIYIFDGEAKLFELKESFGAKSELYRQREELRLEDFSVQSILKSPGAVLVEAWVEPPGPASPARGRGKERGRCLAAAMRSEGETFGIVSVVLMEADSYALSFIELVSSELGSSIKRKRVEEALEKHRADLEKLVEERTKKLGAANEQLRNEGAARELAESGRRYYSEFIEQIIANSQVGIYALDKEGRVQIWNQGMERQFDVTSGEVVGKNIFDVFSVLREEPLGGAIESALREGEAFERAALRHRTMRRGERVINTKVNPLRDAAGEVVGAVIITEDVTELKRAEEALRDSETRYRSLVESVHGGMALVDGDEKFLFVNPGMCEILGYAKDELVGTDIKELLYDGEVQKLVEQTRVKLESKKATKYEIAMRHKDGSRRDLLVSSTPCWGEGGEYLYTMGVAIDITDQKKTEADLEAKTRELEEAHRRADELLRNILPAQVIDELTESRASQPRSFDEVSVVYLDFAGFTEVSVRTKYKALLTKLAAHFHAFDLIVKDHGLEKIKTLGDEYIFAGGLFAEGNQLVSCAEAALDILKFVGRRGWQVRIGLHAGPCIAALIKGWRMTFDIWGEAVDTAYRLRRAGEPGRINVSARVHQELADRFVFDDRGTIAEGDPTPMYYLLERREAEAAN